MDSAPQAALHWDRGALEIECDRAAIVQAGVEAYLGRAVFSADGRLVVRVSLSRLEEAGAARVVARVRQEDASGRAWGERTVAGDNTCASLDDPLTLVVALMVDGPPVEEDSMALEATSPSPTPPPPKQTQTPREAPEPAPGEGREIQTAPSLERALTAPGHAAFLGLGLLSMGALPSPAWGGGVVATLKPEGFWGIGVEAGALARQRKALGSGHIDLSLLLLRASLCPLQGVDGKVWWSACASMGVARLRAESHDLLDSRSRSEWIPLPSASVRAAWLPGHALLVVAGLEAAFPVSPDRYIYRDPQGMRHTAFEVSQLMVTANLGVGVLLD